MMLAAAMGYSNNNKSWRCVGPRIEWITFFSLSPGFCYYYYYFNIFVKLWIQFDYGPMSMMVGRFGGEWTMNGNNDKWWLLCTCRVELYNNNGWTVNGKKRRVTYLFGGAVKPNRKIEKHFGYIIGNIRQETGDRNAPMCCTRQWR